jgi:hypothetical protein
MYLFKKSQNRWIFGDTVDSECPAGVFRIEPSTDSTTVTIRYCQRDIFYRSNMHYSAFKKENGTAYSSFAEFRDAYFGFFSREESEVLVNADYIDTTSATLIYEGYKTGSTYRICRIDISTPVISRTWATGAWASRTSLTYN